MTGLVCWWCGAEAADVTAVSTMDGRARVLLVSWPAPADDHPHTVKPPAADEPASLVHAVFLRAIGAGR